MTNPYTPGPDLASPQPPVGPMLQPQVVVWYRVYCSCFLLLYILVGIGGVSVLLFASEIAANSPNPDKDVERLSNIFMGIVLSVISVLLCVLFAIGLMIPRKKWGWIFGFFPIAIGLTSPCCMPASIPLLIFWLKANNKRWFHVE